jgi:membrane fusion protein (multidrug efflux system)
VPEDAIVPEGERHFVYRVADGRVALTEVLIGKRKDTRVEVRSGVSPNDLIVTAGQLKLRDGVAVQTTTSDEAVAKAAPTVAPASAAKDS